MQNARLAYTCTAAERFQCDELMVALGWNEDSLELLISKVYPLTVKWRLIWIVVVCSFANFETKNKKSLAKQQTI